MTTRFIGMDPTRACGLAGGEMILSLFPLFLSDQFDAFFDGLCELRRRCHVDYHSPLITLVTLRLRDWWHAKKQDRIDQFVRCAVARGCGVVFLLANEWAIRKQPPPLEPPLFNPPRAHSDDYCDKAIRLDAEFIRLLKAMITHPLHADPSRAVEYFAVFWGEIHERLYNDPTNADVIYYAHNIDLAVTGLLAELSTADGVHAPPAHHPFMIAVLKHVLRQHGKQGGGAHMHLPWILVTEWAFQRENHEKWTCAQETLYQALLPVCIAACRGSPALPAFWELLKKTHPSTSLVKDMEAGGLRFGLWLPPLPPPPPPPPPPAA